jgi:hypothetical protein
MKLTSLILAAALLFSLVTLSASHAADCAGPWQKGPTCQKLGLDTHRGTCLPGEAYETLCDDSPEGYRICQGPRRCTSDAVGGNDCRQWDFAYNRPCPEGYVNYDCQGGCEPGR